MDNRIAKKATALLSSTGYLRLSSDLVPSKERSLGFIITPLPAEKRLRLQIFTHYQTGSSYEYRAKRKALYANSASRCPLVAIKSAMKFLGIKLPKKSKEFSVKKRGDILTVQF